MSNKSSKLQLLRTFVQSAPIIHARDLAPMEIPRKYLGVLCDEGVLVRIGRGMYVTADGMETQNMTLAHIAKAVPKGVICLLSALRFHEIGTQMPHRVWLALDRRAAKPSIVKPKIQLVRFSGAALTEGVGRHMVAGTEIHVYGPAKTIADCFKYRNKIGLDIALEALKEGIRTRKADVGEIWKYAKICRVAKIMQPYMEALV